MQTLCAVVCGAGVRGTTPQRHPREARAPSISSRMRSTLAIDRLYRPFSQKVRLSVPIVLHRDVAAKLPAVGLVGAAALQQFVDDALRRQLLDALHLRGEARGEVIPRCAPLYGTLAGSLAGSLALSLALSLAPPRSPSLPCVIATPPA
eukprot:1699930-Prymnesium_polylepis.1